MQWITTLSLPLTFDAILILISGLLLVYCIRLNRNMKRFSESKEGFAKAIAAFIQTYDQAEALLKNVRESTEISEKTLSHKLERAQQIIDELDVMISTGNNLANRIEKQSTALKASAVASTIPPIASATSPASSSIASPSSAPPKEAIHSNTVNAIPQSRMEKELLEKIRRQSA